MDEKQVTTIAQKENKFLALILNLLQKTKIALNQSDFAANVTFHDRL